MKDDQKERFTAARAVMRALRQPDFRTTLRDTSADGERPIVVVLPDDPVSVLFETARGHNGFAYVGLANPDGHVEFITLTSSRYPSVSDHESEKDPECPIHANTSVGMLFMYLRTFRKPLTCREANPDVRIELVDDSGLESLAP